MLEKKEPKRHEEQCFYGLGSSKHLTQPVYFVLVVSTFFLRDNNTRCSVLERGALQSAQVGSRAQNNVY